MTCRKDVGKSWNQKEMQILEEIVLVCDIMDKVTEALDDVLRLSDAIGSELKILRNKVILIKALFKLASTADDQDPLREERLQELNMGIKKFSVTEKGFLRNLIVADEQLITGMENWREILLDVKSFHELKGMKAEDRKGLLERNAICLSIVISGKEWFENFQDEWDGVKYELDESILGYMKELVVIAKEPVEPS